MNLPYGVHQFAPFLLNLLRNLMKNQWKEDIDQKGYILDKLSTPTLLSQIQSSCRSMCSLSNTMDQSTFCESNQTQWTWQRSCSKALSNALFTGDEEIVKLLIREGASPDTLTHHVSVVHEILKSVAQLSSHLTCCLPWPSLTLISMFPFGSYICCF